MAKLNSGTRIYGNLTIDTWANITGTTTSTSTTTGALLVSGGVGVAGQGVFGGNLTVGNMNQTRANLLVFGGNLNAGVGSSIALAEFYTTNANGSYLRILNNRHTQGANWESTSTKIQQMIDVTPQGYIEFNPIGATYGVAIGQGGTEIMRLASSGNVVINATTASTNTTTGALVVAGGAGVAGNINVGGNVVPSANLTYNLGSTTAWWNNVYGVSVQAKYADLAEHYTADDLYGPGTVVVFGGEQEITTTDISHDTRVAGVISANPAYLMNAANPGLPVALTGRVPCLVQGPVFKGQVLVTSTTVGTAQGIDNTKFTPGCVVGKSLATINSNTIETIEVVVGRF